MEMLERLQKDRERLLERLKNLGEQKQQIDQAIEQHRGAIGYLDMTIAELNDAEPIPELGDLAEGEPPNAARN